MPIKQKIVDTAKLKREHPYGFKRNTFAFPGFEAINDCRLLGLPAATAFM